MNIILLVSSTLVQVDKRFSHARFGIEAAPEAPVWIWANIVQTADGEIGSAAWLVFTLSPINSRALGIPGGCAILEGIPCQMETPHAIMLMQ